MTASAECGGSALRFSLGQHNGASGHLFVALQFMNISAHSCYVRGYPTVVELRGSKPSVSAAKTVSGFLNIEPTMPAASEKIQLAPGQSAAAMLAWADVDDKSGGLYDAAHCPDYGASLLRVTAPGSSVAVQVPATSLGICADLQVSTVTTAPPGTTTGSP